MLAGLLSTTNQKRDPLQHLPPEILDNVFSRLKPSHVQECMAVSREWQKNVPHLSAVPWQTLHLQPRRSLTEAVTAPTAAKEPPFYECIKVVHCLKYDTVDSICDFMFTTANWEYNNIHTFWLSDCNINDPVLFLGTLKQTLGANLRVLWVESSWSNLPILGVMAACPRLETLYYHVADDNKVDLTDIYQSEPATDSLGHFKRSESLQCLSFDYPIHKKRLRLILERCPNLRCVRLANNELRKDNDNYWRSNEEICDLNMIQQLCPHLECIECNKGNFKSYSQKHRSYWWKTYAATAVSPASIATSEKLMLSDPHNSTTRSDDGNKRSKLRELSFVGTKLLLTPGYKFDDLYDTLLQAQGTLEVLHIASCHLDRRFDTLVMRKLRELALKNDISLFGYHSTLRIDEFMSRCSSLETLELNLAVGVITNAALPTAIASLSSLKTLSFVIPRANWYTSIRIFGYERKHTAVCNILRAIGNNNGACNLKTLILGSTLDDAFVQKGFTLTGIMLDAASKIHSLRDIQIHCVPYSDDNLNLSNDLKLTDEALCRFIRATSSHLEKIWFSNRKMSSSIYQAIGKMDSLKELRICKAALPSIKRTNMDLLFPDDVWPANTTFKRLIIDCNVTELDDIAVKDISYLEVSKGFYKIVKEEEWDGSHNRIHMVRLE